MVGLYLARDDTPENNERGVVLAQVSGIEVFQFYSTASAKAWIVANEGNSRKLQLKKYSCDCYEP